MVRHMKNKKHIPFKFYYKNILIALAFVICIIIISLDGFKIGKKNQNYDVPFIKVVNGDEKLVRIYPTVDQKELISDNNLGFDFLLSLLGKEIHYRDFSGYNFGRIDQYMEKGIYEVFDRFDNNIATIFENGKVVGFTYRYLDSASLKWDNYLNQYLDEELNRIKSFLGDNFIVETKKESKDFIVEYKKFIYIITIRAENLNEESFYNIIMTNSKFSVEISVFLDIESYKKYK